MLEFHQPAGEGVCAMNKSLLRVFGLLLAGATLLGASAVVTADQPLIEEGAVSKGAGNLIVGPDKNMWFATGDQLGSINDKGQSRYISVGTGLTQGGMTTGPDGNIW